MVRGLGSAGWRYLFGYLLFKVGIACLLLQAGWDSLQGAGGGIERAAIVAGLAFLPAAFAKPFYSWTVLRTPRHTLPIALVACGALVLFETVTSSLRSEFFFLNHFLLWVGIFVGEVSFERRFVALGRSLSPDSASAFGGYSIAFLQAGMLLGPVVLALFFDNSSMDATWAYFFVAFVFFCTAGMAGSEKKPEVQSFRSPTLNQMGGRTSLAAFAFGTLWAVFALFNMVIPVVAKRQFDGSFEIAAILEGVLAVGSGVMGVGFHKLSRLGLNPYTALVGLLISVCLFSWGSAAHSLAIGIFFMSFFYTWLRVAARNAVSRTFLPDQAAVVFAWANVMSAPMVAITLLLSSFELNVFGSWYALGIAFILSGLSFVVILAKE